jgi:DNA-binding beta-propeller fold protein YncE
LSTSADAQIGSEFVGYRVEALLGRGGMGVVYSAYDLRLKRTVALKLVAPELSGDERFRDRFLRETEVAASLEHPHVVPIHDAGEVDGKLYLAMRYVEGSDLKTLLRAEGALAPARALSVCAQVAGALDAAHERGLVHRDVKPSNVLLDPREHVYLADFGLTSRLADGDIPAGARLSLGTPPYVAPEQIEGGEVDGRADLYSLGCLLFECLTGEPPFVRDSELAVLWAHLQEEPPRASVRNRVLPEAVDAVVARALAKKPEERYASCGELVEAARAALGIAAPAGSRWLRAPVLLSLAGLVLIAAALAAYFAIRGGGEPHVRRDTLVRIDPATNRVVDSIPVGPGASSVTFGDGYLWVTSREDRTLWRVDPKTGRARVTRLAGGTPLDVAVRHGLAVVTYGPFTVGYELIDARSGASEGSLHLPGADDAQAPVAAGADGIWLAASGFAGENVGLVTRAPLVSGPATALERVPIPENPHFLFFYTPDSGSYNDVAVGAGGVWLARDTGPFLKRIDPKAKRVVATIELPFQPKSLAVGAGAVWVTGLFDDVLARLDAQTNRITMTVPLPAGTDGVAVGEGAVWVASTIAGTVTRIDQQTGEILATIKLGHRPQDVTTGAGDVWVTTHTA